MKHLIPTRVLRTLIQLCNRFLSRPTTADRSEIGWHSLFPDSAGQLFSAAMARLDASDEEGARSVYQKALAVGLSRTEQSTFEVNAAIKRGEKGKAYRLALSSIEAGNISPELLESAAIIAYESRDYVASAEHYREAIAAGHSAAAVYTSFGAALVHSGRPEEAIQWHLKALRTAPRMRVVHTNYAVALHECGRYSEEAASLEHALRLFPDEYEVRFALGAFKISSGFFSEGWPLYEARLAGPTGDKIPKVIRALPRWNGERSDHGTLAIVAEQGYGDGIMAARLFAETKRRFGGKVVLFAVVELGGLLESVAGVDEARPLSNSVSLVSDVTAWVPCMSLFGMLGVGEEDNFFVSGPYVAAPRADREYWREQLAEVTGPGLKVGLAWFGNANHPLDKVRSVQPEYMSAFDQLAGIAGIHFVALQLAGVDGFRQSSCLPIHDFPASFVTFIDTAACIENLDLVICVDTSTCHLAAALGKPTWMLSPPVAEWRWGYADTTPWYPSLRIFRQRTLNDWSEVLGRVREALIQTAGGEGK
jgi:tetratricopeptide (TPR) repeat protein